MNLEQRIRKLETTRSQQRRCPACGGRTDGPVTFAIGPHDPTRTRYPDGLERCPECGRLERFTIRIDLAG